MGFPFTIKRTPGIVYSWEKNDWSRRHGYQMPIDTYLLLQWGCLIILDLAFFCFLIYFVEERNQQDPVKPFDTWNCKIMLLLSTLVKILSVSTSMVETEDPVVTRQHASVSRSQTYVRKFGIPVIDSYTGICNICRIKVSKSTRHCKLCNKCIDRMDHHCKWLNCCIGQSNYRLFLVLVCSAFVALSWYAFIALQVAWSCFYDKNTFVMNAVDYFDMDLKASQDTTIDRMYYASVILVLLVVSVVLVSLVSITRLLVFHVKLARLNLTTIEFLSLPTYKHYDFEDDLEDDIYFDVDDENWDKAGLHRMIAHKMRRAWIVTLRTVIPGYRYRRLKNSRRSCVNLFSCCSPTKKPHLLPVKQRSHDSMNMEEFFATKTIRPVITLSGDEEEGDTGPDYNDDMGLDMTILKDENLSSTQRVVQRSNGNNSKLARMLDMSEQDVSRQIQQEQRLNMPKQENALDEL